MLVKPFKFIQAEKYLKGKNWNILDIGAGSHSASITKEWIPSCHYTGVDLPGSYENDAKDFKAMDEFIEMDLTELNFDKIPNDRFDLLIMSHVIEHLKNGDEVVKGLVPKLRSGGLMYIEFPSERSVDFPSKPETLNFYDDPTHCRIYTVKELEGALKEKGMLIKSSGIRRQWINILLMPFKIIYQKLTKGFVRGGVYWDYYGFAEYICAVKP